MTTKADNYSVPLTDEEVRKLLARPHSPILFGAPGADHSKGWSADCHECQRIRALRTIQQLTTTLEEA